MAVTVNTKKPKVLLNLIKKEISNGSIKTWSCDSEGDFTHDPKQWHEEAWFRPYKGQGLLIFGLIGREGVEMTKPIYGIYHGRFIEMLLTHFDAHFDTVFASAQIDEEIDCFK